MIVCKSPREIELMRKAGKVLFEALQLAKEIAKVGVTTECINEKLEEYLLRNNCRPIFKGYKGFPKSICTSINDEIVHGIPGKTSLREGDILSIDIGSEYKKYMADTATTFPIGKITKKAQRLLDVCEESLHIAIKTVKADIKLSEVCRAIQNYVEGEGYSVVRDYTGHGIGRQMHEDPQIPNFVPESLLNNDVTLTAGMTIAIEPMICEGTFETEVLDNNWTVRTKDHSLSAHFEHTMVVTENGADILTV
ncbi:MAG: type I methionyl aminopeptidase [Candidatus Anammoxibacter sp.]